MMLGRNRRFLFQFFPRYSKRAEGTLLCNKCRVVSHNEWVNTIERLRDSCQCCKWPSLATFSQSFYSVNSFLTTLNKPQIKTVVMSMWRTACIVPAQARADFLLRNEPGRWAFCINGQIRELPLEQIWSFL